MITREPGDGKSSLKKFIQEVREQIELGETNCFRLTAELFECRVREVEERTPRALMVFIF
jgi:hypothetical protein